MYQKSNFDHVPFFINFAIPGKILLFFFSLPSNSRFPLCLRQSVFEALLNWFCFFLYKMEQNRVNYQLQIITTKVGYIKYQVPTSNVAIDINLVN